MDEERRRRTAELIVDGYRLTPQKDDDVLAATWAAVRSIHEEPWDEAAAEDAGVDPRRRRT